MDAEQARALLRKLPHTEETMQWGANLVYWVGDKAIGGKMFALVNLDEDKDPDRPAPFMMFYAGPERYAELLETEGVIPAPYMARIFWVALTHWNVFRKPELGELLQAANHGVYSRLPARVRASLDLPTADLSKLVIARRKLLHERAVKADRLKASAKSTARAATNTRQSVIGPKAAPKKKKSASPQRKRQA